MTNVVILGALARVDDFFEYDGIRELVEQLSPEKFLEKNFLSFEKRYELI